MEKGKHFALLVVEDDTRHIRDLMQVIGELPDDFPLDLEIKCVRTLREVLNYLESAEGVITDVFFPIDPDGDSSELNGKYVVEDCVAMKKPVVMISDQTQRQAFKTEQSQWAHSRGIELFGGSNDRTITTVWKKPWKQALYALIFIALGLEDGSCEFADNRLIRKFVQFEQDLHERGLYFFPNLIAHYLSDEPLVTHIWPTLGRMLEMGFPRT